MSYIKIKSYLFGLIILSLFITGFLFFDNIRLPINYLLINALMIFLLVEVLLIYHLKLYKHFILDFKGIGHPFICSSDAFEILILRISRLEMF